MRPLNVIALLLAAAGALNLGIYGLTRIDPLAAYLGSSTIVVGGMTFKNLSVLYTLFGLAGLYCLSFVGRVFFERKPTTKACPTC